MADFYNENDPVAAEWLRWLIAEGHLPPGKVDSRSIEELEPRDLEGFTHVHFFAGIGDGALPPALPDGLQLDLFGQPPAPASPSRSRARAPVETIRGTCGLTSFASPVPPGPLSLWESRLRERLAMTGSTESPLIWREKVTPAGRSISRLAPWTPPTSGSGSTGSRWRTPTCNDVEKRGNYDKV